MSTSSQQSGPFCKRCGISILANDPMFKQDGYCIDCRAEMHDGAGIIT